MFDLVAAGKQCKPLFRCGQEWYAVIEGNVQVKRSASSSESSEEQVSVVRVLRSTAPEFSDQRNYGLRFLSRMQAKPARSPLKPFQSQVKFALPQLKAAAGFAQKAPTQSMTAESDESSDSSDEAQDTDESSESDESEDAETTTTVAPPPEETTLPPIIDNGRGDSLGSPRDYKSNIFVESNKIEKGPSPYKYYGGNKVQDGINLVSKKSSIYDGKEGNDIEKSLKVYKVNEEPLDEDTSTPEVESQGLDASSGAAEGAQGPAQAQGEESTEEAETASATSESDSASAADGSDSSQSSEEATATPGAADADSSQSSESQESDSAEIETTTEPPVVITAK
ncbi:lisH domain-containing protein C1711.05-like [Scleropages formosus]|uniref:LisH domain-containing protein C1711.05-like n=1 Tax=Scleropages formosus TaxID=113540 RepID=A0A0P7V203_SCLFO|nr:lisH domain-containing protein C1711.05-like [Scleropages formosus]